MSIAGRRSRLMHPEHLNTPRLVADASQTTVWRWDQGEPFGVNAANEDPDGNSVAFDLPLRLPGQYLDKETNLHYNMAREYWPDGGRYIESDPIGLSGGLNTYAYVNGSPILLVDPEGRNWKKKVVEALVFVISQFSGDPGATGRRSDQESKRQEQTRQIEEKKRAPTGKGGKGRAALPGFAGVTDIVESYCQENGSDPACVIIRPKLDQCDPCDPWCA